MRIRLLIICFLFFSSACTMPKQHILCGKSKTNITQLLGTPYSMRTEAPYQLYTYKQNDCTMLIFYKNSIVQHVSQQGTCPTFTNNKDLK